ncbi:rhodanese-related sulfurtransferase [Lysinibacillus parviboronicapiens]|uniref:Rhodanese-related sulfurtransferase n=1 Tax=Lysinibacillus parviboronicapiens TaxID=436516 RepID=A0ABV2PDE0_9BACI
MTHKQFDEDQLEQVLNNAPKLSDHRSKDEVLQRLLADARLQDNSHLQAAVQEPIESQLTTHEVNEKQDFIQAENKDLPITKRKYKKMPLFMSVAAVFVLTLIAGSMFVNNNDSPKDQATPDSATFSSMPENRATKEIESSDNVMDSSIVAEHTRMMSLRTSVYEEDLTDAVVFRIGLAGGKAAESVPMTYIIPNERVVADFGKEKPTSLQMYEKYAPQIDEEAMGFTNYHPYKGELEEKGETLVHVLPKKNAYDIASASVSKYLGSLKDTFSDSDYKEIAFENADGTAYEFSQVGEPSEPMALIPREHYNFYVYTETNGTEYLSPDFRKTFSTVTEALTDMRHKNDDVYVSAIPENVTYTVKEEADGVVVTFDVELDLMTMDAVRATQLIEAMMLTAASFDKKLRLDNVVQDSWEGFDLTKYLPMPVGANKQYMPE